MSIVLEKFKLQAFFHISLASAAGSTFVGVFAIILTLQYKQSRKTELTKKAERRICHLLIRSDLRFTRKEHDQYIIYPSANQPQWMYHSHYIIHLRTGKGSISSSPEVSRGTLWISTYGKQDLPSRGTREHYEVNSHRYFDMPN